MDNIEVVIIPNIESGYIIYDINKEKNYNYEEKINIKTQNRKLNPNKNTKHCIPF